MSASASVRVSASGQGSEANSPSAPPHRQNGSAAIGAAPKNAAANGENAPNARSPATKNAAAPQHSGRAQAGRAAASASVCVAAGGFSNMDCMGSSLSRSVSFHYRTSPKRKASERGGDAETVRAALRAAGHCFY